MPHALTRDDVDLERLAEELAERLGRPVALSARKPGQVDDTGDELPGLLIVLDGDTGDELEVDPAVVAAALVEQRTLTADRLELPADGVTPALVTYFDERPGAPTSVTFTANGAVAVVDLVGGRAQLEVTAAVPGPVDVTVDALPGVVVTLTAQEAS
jgi:hypothetical protein